MGKASYVPGILIFRDKGSRMPYLDQENYLDKILEQFNMTNCKPFSTPVRRATILNKKLCSTNKIKIKEMENVPY